MLFVQVLNFSGLLCVLVVLDALPGSHSPVKTDRTQLQKDASVPELRGKQAVGNMVDNGALSAVALPDWSYARSAETGVLRAWSSKLVDWVVVRGLVSKC